MDAPSQQAFSKARGKMNELSFKNNMFEHMVRFDYGGSGLGFVQPRGIHGCWVLCQHGGAERVRDPAVHKGAGRGRPVRRRVM